MNLKAAKSVLLELKTLSVQDAVQADERQNGSPTLSSTSIMLHEYQQKH